MQLQLFVSILLARTTVNAAVTQCCPEPNIVANRTCLDGSDVAILSCTLRHLVGPTLKNPENIAVDPYENLIITDANDHVFKIKKSMYCMTRDKRNLTDLAYVCYEDENNATIVAFYVKICCAIVTFVLSLTILTIYLFTEDLRDIEGKCFANFTAGLCVKHLTVMLLPVANSMSGTVCNAIPFVYYTAILFCYIWLSVISFHIWKLTTPIFRKQIKWFVIYCLYGFGVPTLILATALTYHNLQETGPIKVREDDCVTIGSIGVWTYFYGPLLVILLMSVLPLLWAAKRLWVDIDRRERAQCVVRLRAKCRLFGHLTALMGSVLIIDLIMESLHERHNVIVEYFWEFLDCRNYLVGGAIFLAFVTYRNKVLVALAKRGLFGIKFPDRWAKLVDEERDEKDNEEATLTPFASA